MEETKAQPVLEVGEAEAQLLPKIGSEAGVIIYIIYIYISIYIYIYIYLSIYIYIYNIYIITPASLPILGSSWVSALPTSRTGWALVSSISGT